MASPIAAQAGIGAYQAGQASRKIVFRTHRQPDIRLTDQVRMDGALLNIREVRPLGRLHMEIHTEGAAS